MQFSDLMPHISWQDVAGWFAYNPNEPLLFNSARFLKLFVVFYAVYILLRNTFHLRILYVIAFSLYFYQQSSGIYFLLLLFTSILDYTLSYFLYRETNAAKRRIYVWFSVIVNLTFLG